MLHEMRLNATTNGSGDATVNGEQAVVGRLYAIQVVIGTLAATSDLTISTQGHAASKTLLTLTDVGANGLYYPRDLVHSETGAALTGTSGGDRALPLLIGIPRLVVAQGGDTKAGGVLLFWYD